MTSRNPQRCCKDTVGYSSDSLASCYLTATSLVHAFISCRLDYCNALLYGIADCQLQRLQSVQNAAARLVTGLRTTEHITPIPKSLHWLSIRQRLTYKLATLVHKCINGRAPEYLAEFCHPSVDRRPGMRSAVSGKLHVPRTQTSFGDRLFAIAGPRTWNNLPDAIQDSSLSFLPARRYASAGNSDRNVSVCPSVRHAPVLCQNEES